MVSDAHQFLHSARKRWQWQPSDPSALLGKFPQTFEAHPKAASSRKPSWLPEAPLPWLRLKAQGLGLTLPVSRPVGPGHPGWTLTTCGGACCPWASLKLAWNSPSKRGDHRPFPGPQEDQPEVHLPTAPEQVWVTGPTSRRVGVQQGPPRQAGIPARQAGEGLGTGEGPASGDWAVLCPSQQHLVIH